MVDNLHTVNGKTFTVMEPLERERTIVMAKAQFFEQGGNRHGCGAMFATTETRAQQLVEQGLAEIVTRF